MIWQNFGTLGCRVPKQSSWVLEGPASGGARRGPDRYPLPTRPRQAGVRQRTQNSLPVYALNFYSPIVASLLRSYRKTCTIRLGDKSAKYKKGLVVQVLVGARYSPRDKIFDAVIDKDRAAALLASELQADALVLVTGVDAVLLDFGKPTQRELTVVAAEEMHEHARAGQFPAGSMGPKVEAALDFIDAGGGVAVITSANLMFSALDSLSGPGTHIVRSTG